MHTGPSEVPDLLADDLLPGYRVDADTGARLSLPWPDDPDEREALARRSLGPGAINWAEGRSDLGPGLTDPMTGRPWRFTRGQRRWMVCWYELTPEGRWRWRSGVKRGAKGTGKDYIAAAWLLVELLGPCRLDGWAEDDQPGLDPVGRPLGLPLVQVAANSEPQAKDLLRVANAMLGREARDYYGLDVGETRTIIRGTGGRMEVLTASEKSAEGDPATAVAMNESQHMTESSGGHRLAQVARRNIGKSPASVQARTVEFTNAPRLGQDSVAERSLDAWQAQVAGRARRHDILYDSVEAPPATDLSDDTQRTAALRAAYLDAPWADLERLSDEILDPRTPVADSVRFYLNGLAVAEDAWVDPGRFDALADSTVVVADGDRVVLFLDCSKYLWRVVDGETLFLNRALVINGFAIASLYEPNDAYIEVMRDAEAVARNSERGLWSACSRFGAPLDPPEPEPTQQPDPPSGGNCDPNYSGACIPPYPPDLDCPEVDAVGFQVVGTDVHGFDADGDGIACDPLRATKPSA